MRIPLKRDQLIELLRYYQVGIINTLFGYGLYALLVRLGLNLYVAQFLAHFTAVIFNYVTYSRHVFRGIGPVKARYVISYIGNYLISLAVLAIISQFVSSPYAAGLGGIVITSVINYFVLKHIVFVERTI